MPSSPSIKNQEQFMMSVPTYYQQAILNQFCIQLFQICQKLSISLKETNQIKTGYQYSETF